MTGIEWAWIRQHRHESRRPRPVLQDPYDSPASRERPSPVSKPNDAVRRIPANKGKRYPIEILTPNEVMAILGAFSGTERCGIRDRAIVAVMYRTGMRVSETLHLRSKDIDHDRGMIRVLFGKGQRARTVGIDQGGLDFVEAWERERSRHGYPEDAPLFCTSTSRVMNSSCVRLFLKRTGRKARVRKRVHAHGFRHTFAFELAMEGVPLGIIQSQLGHVWAHSTSTYLGHIAPIEVVNRMRGRTWLLPPSLRPVSGASPHTGLWLPDAPPPKRLPIRGGSATRPEPARPSTPGSDPPGLHLPTAGQSHPPGS